MLSFGKFRVSLTPDSFGLVLVYLSWRLKCSIVITRCLPSVRPSVVVNFSKTFQIFDFFSETAERNSTKLYRNQDLNVLYQVCAFREDWKNKMAAPASDWLRHFRPLPWTELIERKLSGSKISTSSTKFVFLCRSEEQDGRPDLWLIETFSTSPLKPLNGIQRNLTGNKISTSNTKFCIFRADRKNKMDNWNIVDCDMKQPIQQQHNAISVCLHKSSNI